MKQFCSSFLNGSTISASLVRVIKAPRELSAPNHTEVVFAVVLPAESSSGVMVVKNGTLEYIVQNSAYFISKHLGGYKIVYVNNFPPSSERRCDKETKNNNTEKPTSKRPSSDAALIGGICGGLIIVVLAIAALTFCCLRRR